MNLFETRNREHGRKPDEVDDVIEANSLETRLEMFARGARDGWTASGDQAEKNEIRRMIYSHNSQREESRDWVEAAE